MAWNVVDYKRRLKAFDVDRNVKKAIKEGSWEIINLNKKNLSKGLNSFDKIVGTYSSYTQAWARKQKPNEPKIAGSTYNFNWTGAFINGIFITYENNKINFHSTGMGLTKKSLFIKTNELLGVSENKKNIINYDILAPYLRRYFKIHIGSNE
jgi:hypothetical protein